MLECLRPQVQEHEGEVEILINDDICTKSIGKKRNELLEASRGKYICFIDDDDIVHTNYLTFILNAINKSVPDGVGFKMFIHKPRGRQTVTFSSKYKAWHDDNRCLIHLNPVRRELAMQVMFPDRSTGEDRVYSLALVNLIKKEEFINEVLYHYFV